MAQTPDLSPRGPHDIYMFITCAEAYLQGQQYYAETHQAVCPAHPPCHLGDSKHTESDCRILAGQGGRL